LNGATAKTTERYPRLYELYSEGMRRGDAPAELIPAPAPVVKADASKAEILETIQKRAAPIAAAQKITKDQALLRVLETPEGKQLYQAYCDARA
jgi:hypothetical protein